jgi:very-short-patch-repair endonuclease
VETYLKRKNINYTWQKKFDDCKNINKLPFDFFLPDYNTIVEFDGVQHFEPVKKFGGEEHFKRIKKHDEIKNNYCKDNNINLIRLTNEDLTNNIIEWGLDIELSRIKAEINMNCDN